MSESVMHLKSNENQARGLAEYGYRFMKTPMVAIAPEVWDRLELFYLDSVACGISAISRQANAPTVLRKEALLNYKNENGCYCYGSKIKVSPEKAILANSSSVREWDSNGTVFGYNPTRGDTKGEFGHNDFYPVALAAAQLKGLDG
jgi:2-methylcitrate dehydratase